MHQKNKRINAYFKGQLLSAFSQQQIKNKKIEIDDH